MDRRALSATLAVAALAAAGCVDQHAVKQYSEYSELVSLRGAAVTMLERHEISVDEARMLKVMLDAARRAIDAGQQALGQTELDQIKGYLRSRQGQPL